MKIYFDKKDLKDSIPRKFYADWIKPLFPKPRHEIYGMKEDDLILSSNPKNADLLILPLTWNYYFENRKIIEACEILKYYETLNKLIITWVTGDYTYSVPSGKFIILQHNLYKSKQKKYEYAYPAIIRDPFEYLNLYGIPIASFFGKPKISFCGAANRNSFDKYENLLREFLFKIKNKIFKPYQNLDVPLSGMSLRGRVLQSFKKNINLEANIILRKRKDNRHISKEKYKFEYWNNMLDSPFTLCVRGNGNFSVRFYETLALGRIPVLIDTDCVLPLSNEIDWNKHCIIVSNENSYRIAESVQMSLNEISNKEIKNMQIENRKLWVDKLSYSGFFFSFSKKLLEKHGKN